MRYVSLLFVVLIGMSAAAQTKVMSAEPPPSPVKAIKIPVIRVDPSGPVPNSKKLPPSLITARQAISRPTGAPPASISWDQRAALLRQAGVTVGATTPPRSLHLTTRLPFVSGAGAVRFTTPYMVAPDEDKVIFFPTDSGWTPSVTARLNLARGGRYVVDFNVSTRGAIRMHAYAGGDDTLDFTAPGGPHRVSLVVESTGSGYTEVLLWANQFWDFLSVDMTRID